MATNQSQVIRARSRLSKHTKEKKGNLSQATRIGDGFAVCLQVYQHLGKYSYAEIYVSQGLIGKEEVHMGVEVGVRDDIQNDEQTPEQSPGTWIGTAQAEEAAVLDHLRLPGGRILSHLSVDMVPCLWETF